MKYIYIIATLSLLLACVNETNQTKDTNQTKVTRTSEMQFYVDDLLARDAKNKKLELEYLEQIRIAQENNDTEAFEFFFQEYVDVERLKIPEELKKEPNYFQGGNKVKY